MTFRASEPFFIAAIVSLLAAFKFSKARDADGKEVKVEVVFSEASIR